MNFVFNTDKESFGFAVDVVRTLSVGFELSEENALKLINSEWGHIEFFNNEHPFHHESPEYFANELFFGHGSFWWLPEKQRRAKRLAPLSRKPLETSKVINET